MPNLGVLGDCDSAEVGRTKRVVKKVAKKIAMIKVTC